LTPIWHVPQRDRFDQISDTEEVTARVSIKMKSTMGGSSAWAASTNQVILGGTNRDIDRKNWIRKHSGSTKNDSQFWSVQVELSSVIYFFQALVPQLGSFSEWLAE
jgi:hypothetical protein